MTTTEAWAVKGPDGINLLTVTVSETDAKYRAHNLQSLEGKPHTVVRVRITEVSDGQAV